MGSQLTKNYDVDREPLSFGGIGGPWKIYGATRKDREKSPVSIFMFDKKTIDRKPDKNDTINRLKLEVTNLVRLRHPCILQVVEPLLEDKNTLAFITEPVQYCLGDLLRRPHILSTILCDTEVRLGLLDLIQAIAFIHTEARLIHFAICPDNIYITIKGKWKLAGFGFASSITAEQVANLDPSLDIVLSGKTMRYQAELEKLAPMLHFTAPEVVSTKSSGQQADIFSLGCTIFAIYKALSNTSSDIFLLSIEDYSVSGHRASCQTVQRMGPTLVNCVPDFLGENVLRMVNVNPQDRSNLHELSVSKAFQTPFVKAIYYLEHLQEKQESQKLQFFKGLTQIIDKFDRVIMNKRLLPALVQNMQHPNMTPFILPNILSIIKTCEVSKELFQSSIWPSIAKLSSGKEMPAQSFYLILSEIDVLMNYTDDEQWKKILMPLAFKGYDCGVAQIQETLMIKTPEMVKKIRDNMYVRVQVLPRFLGGILNAKSPSVREAGLHSLAQIYSIFDRSTMVESILPSLEKFKKLDVTGNMIMHLLDVYEGISKSLGHKATAVNIIPALVPLLVEGEVNKSQFERLSNSLMAMINMIKDARSGELQETVEDAKIELNPDADKPPEEPNEVFNDIFESGGTPIFEAPIDGGIKKQEVQNIGGYGGSTKNPAQTSYEMPGRMKFEADNTMNFNPQPNLQVNQPNPMRFEQQINPMNAGNRYEPQQSVPNISNPMRLDSQANSMRFEQQINPMGAPTSMKFEAPSMGNSGNMFGKLALKTQDNQNEDDFWKTNGMNLNKNQGQKPIQALRPPSPLLAKQTPQPNQIPQPSQNSFQPNYPAAPQNFKSSFTEQQFQPPQREKSPIQFQAPQDAFSFKAPGPQNTPFSLPPPPPSQTQGGPKRTNNPFEKPKVKIDTEDFFNEFLQGKKDPFDGL
ncbi:unnamed protein product [Blepharisma stoltei]|uniref:Protein kinase domain-containing protein n=1 Tax=Blepharisma stoltei TaxID=1481888 RepID=A0AAU9K148_9CILI|nr:unnamed protein product [Blepharisma stoltei]